MYFVGCDLGSTTGKAVIMDGEGNILAGRVIRSARGPEATFNRVMAEAVRLAGLEGRVTVGELVSSGSVVTTGYGRGGVPGVSNDISEISCHARGAVFMHPETRTIVDIGGQDCKVISVSRRGRVVDFQMNDKCSAGTGRFFEVMGRVLDMSLDDLAAEALRSSTPCQISKQCSVFAESEVISLVNSNVPVPDIAAGIHDSIARRIHGMIYRVGLAEDLVLTGGCARNPALRHALEQKVGVRLGDLGMDPQLMGAVGAALYARDGRSGAS